MYAFDFTKWADDRVVTGRVLADGTLKGVWSRIMTCPKCGRHGHRVYNRGPVVHKARVEYPHGRPVLVPTDSCDVGDSR